MLAGGGLRDGGQARFLAHERGHFRGWATTSSDLDSAFRFGFFFGRKIVVVFEDRGKEDEREENLVIFTQERHALIREILARP